MLISKVERQMEPFWFPGMALQSERCFNSEPCPTSFGASVDLTEDGLRADGMSQECILCLIAGQTRSICKARAEWDWWVVGGRFNGLLTGNHEYLGVGASRPDDPEAKARLAKYSDFNVKLRANTALPEDVCIDWYLRAIVTPDFHWVEIAYKQGEPGEKATLEDPDHWLARQREVLKRYQDGHVIVSIDAHL
ncbi:MAG TPA: hypothetical protein QGH10_11610 [Armatimonadota bacterium]|nr:hypothetical protein [Armatimonadota bacterium]